MRIIAVVAVICLMAATSSSAANVPKPPTELLAPFPLDALPISPASIESTSSKPKDILSQPTVPTKRPTPSLSPSSSSAAFSRATKSSKFASTDLAKKSTTTSAFTKSTKAPATQFKATSFSTKTPTKSPTTQFRTASLSTKTPTNSPSSQTRIPFGSSGSSKVPKRAASVDAWASDEITRFERTEGLNGEYYFNFQTVNGINMEERGAPKVLDDVSNDISQQVVGEYSYVAPDGTPIVMSYVANENGFQPLGAHIPTPPPIPEAIQRALNYVRSQQP